MYTPLSLSEVSDSELVRKVKEDADSQAVTELMNRHSGIYHTCTKPYLNSPHFSYQESLDEKPYTIYSAALGYDPQRGAFGTFLGSVTRNRCLQIIKEKNKFAKNESWEEIDFDILPAQSLSLYSKLEARDGLENIMKVVKALPEKKQRIFTKRYLNHDGRKTTQKWEDIAKSEGQTKWACVLSARTVEKKIREKMGKELIGRTY
jgi:DNA-directed RNA polymerase specialized sigma24 family protein